MKKHTVTGCEDQHVQVATAIKRQSAADPFRCYCDYYSFNTCIVSPSAVPLVKT